MQSVMFLAVIFGFVLMAMAIIGGTVLFAIKMVKSGGLSLRAKRRRIEDAKMMQEIYRGLSGMEERINALETILLDREKERRLT